MMTNFIPYTQGKQYDPAHLRPFDLALAKQGHPLADDRGCEIRLFRDLHGDDNVFGYDSWEQNLNHPTWFASNIVMKIALSKRVRLAPLAIKHDPRTGEDEPLHVGDVLEFAVEVTYFGGSASGGGFIAKLREKL